VSDPTPEALAAARAFLDSIIGTEDPAPHFARAIDAYAALWRERCEGHEHVIEQLLNTRDELRAEVADRDWQISEIVKQHDDDQAEIARLAADLAAMTTARDNALTYYGNECAETRRLRAALGKIVDGYEADGYPPADEMRPCETCETDTAIARAALAPHDKGTTDNGE
jgi:chromosome segregation ATPase